MTQEAQRLCDLFELTGHDGRLLDAIRMGCELSRRGSGADPEYDDGFYMTNRHSPERVATALRENGINIPRRVDHLAADLEETLRRVKAGLAIDELSRRDPQALCALAQTRPLDAHEARMLLGWIRHLEAIIDAGARERDGLRSWARLQSENAELWGRVCRDLGRAIEGVAEAAGASAATPDELPAIVRKHAVTSDIFVRAGNEFTELRALARKVATLLGQPGLEQDPARLGALLVEQVLSGDVAVPGKPEPCNCGGTCAPKGESMVCDTCQRSWPRMKAAPSPGRKRLRRAYRLHVSETSAPLPLKKWAQLTARGRLQEHERARGVRDDARVWCLRKCQAPRPVAPWGPDVERCVCCDSAPCDRSRLGCGLRRSA